MNDMLRRVAEEARLWAPILAAFGGGFDFSDELPELVLAAVALALTELGVDPEAAYRMAFEATSDTYLAVNDG